MINGGFYRENKINKEIQEREWMNMIKRKLIPDVLNSLSVYWVGNFKKLTVLIKSMLSNAGWVTIVFIEILDPEYFRIFQDSQMTNNFTDPRKVSLVMLSEIVLQC